MKKLFKFAVCAVLMGSLVTSCGGNNEVQLDPANPFASEWVEQNGMPPFNKIKASDILPALKAGIAQEDQEIEQIVKATPSFENTILAYHSTGKLLSRVGTAYGALTATEMNEDLLAIQTEYSNLSTQHGNNISLNEDLFKQIKAVYDAKAENNYTAEQIRLIDKTYDSFVRSGANLSPEDKEKMRAINVELSNLSNDFRNKLLKENNNFKLVIDNEKDLAGLPAVTIATAAAAAEAQGLTGKWMFTLSKPSYIPFITYAKNRELRKVMFEGYSNVGNNDNENNTNEITKKIMALRLQKANLMGYKTFADFNLVNSMAKTPEAVFGFIEDLWEPTIKRAKEEVRDMKKIMNKEGIKGEIQPWDWAYYAEKVRANKFNLNESEIQPYFPVTAVRDGAMMVANKLWGITFEEVKDAIRINPETQVFNVYDKDGSFLSVLTWDFHPRATKRGGAWCSRLKSQEYVDGKRVAPITTVTANFTPAVGDTPALLTMDETHTLFHEFGHALQGMFTDVPYPGLTGNPRDFVEFPSQVMENWALHPEVLPLYTKHYKTGEPIPASLIKKISNTGSFNVGFSNGENLAASYLDMVYHTIDNLETINNMDVQKFEKETLAKLGIIPQFIPRYRTTYFNHIWASGYPAGYYSYKWSEILSADGFAAFSTTGDIYNQEVAKRLRELVLSKGSSVDEKTMYKEWRGADPDPKYLMEQLGLN